MRRRLRVAALGAALALAACGGGHTAPATSAAGAPAAEGTLSLSIRIPQASAATPSTVRRLAYISQNTHSLRISLQTVNGQVPNPAVPDIIVAITVAQCPVSGGYATCTISEPAVIGVDVYAFDLYASSDGSGSPLATATQSITITFGVATVADVTFNGVNAGLAAAPSTLTAPADGSIHTLAFTVSASDPSGATIVPPGNYVTPITLSIQNDPNGALHLSTASVTAPATTSGQTSVTVTYDASKSLTQGTILVTAGANQTSVAVAPLIFTPTSARKMFNGAPSTAETISVSESGESAAYTIGGSAPGTSVTATCTPASCAPPTTGGTVAVTLTPTAAGRGTVTIGDPSGATAVVPTGVGSAPAVISNGITPQPSGILSAANGYLFLGQGANVDYVQPLSCTTSCSVGTIAYESLTGQTATDDIVTGASGNFDVQSGSAIGVISPSTCPATACSAALAAHVGGGAHMAYGDDGNLWITTFGTTVYRVAGSTSTTYTFPSLSPNFIAPAADGTLWFTGNSDAHIGHFDPNNCTLTSCPITVYTVTEASATNDLAIDASGNVWVAERNVPYLAEIACTSSCALHEYKYSPSTGIGNISAVAIAPDGLLLAADLTGGIPSIVDLASCSTTTATCPVIYSGGSLIAYSVTAGADGNFWWQSLGHGLVRMIMP